MLELLEFLKNVRITRISRKLDKKTEQKDTDLRAEGAKAACFHTTILTVLCSRYIVYMYYICIY